ncbi:MAG: S-layer homology domain-containing protein [Oscillospiraceae bacterium]|nr:S-layer homology domain-containing protein [Oscillospiraceae bacterium]
MKQRILAILLSLTMMFTLVPTAMAEGDETPAVKTTTGDVTYSDNDAKIENLVYTSGTMTVTGANVTVENVTFGDGAALKVNTSGNFTLKNCTFNGKTDVRTPVTLNVGSATVTGNTFNGTKTDGTPTYYNAIEFAVSSGNKLSSATLSNNIFEAAIKNNYFSTYYYADNAVITAENNVIKLANRGSNAIRISNVTNSNVTFNLNDNSYEFSDASGSSEYEGFIILQDFSTGSAVQDFSKVTLNIKGLTTPDDATRLLYVYDDQDGIIQTNQPVVKGDSSIEKFFVAKVGDTYYKTLAEAVAAAKNNETVTLLKNAETTVELSFTNKAITLDLNGKTVSGTFTDNFSVIEAGENASLTVQDTSVAGTGKIASNKYGISARDGGALIVKRGTIESEYAPLSGNNTAGDMNFTVNGGTLTAKHGPAIYMPGQVNLSITDGVLNGGISLRMGQVSISGGTINAATDGLDSPAEYYHYSGNAWLPDALYVFGGTYTSENTTYGNSLHLNITGGTFNCANGQGSAVAIYDLGKVEQVMEITISDEAKLGTNSTARNAYDKLSLSDIGVTSPEPGFGAHSGQVSTTITGGLFSSDPSAYVPDTHHVEDSGNGSYPFAVKEGAKSDATIIVTAATNAAVSDTIESGDKAKIEAVKDKANVEGMAAAIRDDKKAAIAKAADVTDEQLAGKNMIETEITVKVEAKAADLANGKLTFEASPVATVKVNGAAKGTTVPVTNDMLNGQPITVKLPLPEGFTPKQIKHISSDGSVEYFLKTAKRGAKLFTVDSDNCAVFTITKFSTFELSGTVTYVEPSYYSGSSSDPTYSVTVDKTENGSVTVSPKSASKGDTVTVTVKPDSGYVLETLTVTDKNGNELTLKDKGDGKYTFTMPAGKVEVKATFMEDNSVLNFFYDVPNDAFFYEAVKWAVKSGVTNGLSDTMFGPYESCTRAQIVTFLWRAAGSPEPKTASSFTDVSASAYYAKAVAWAVENGITNGMTETTFAPDATCTRGQSVTFLHRALKGTASGSANFTDVKPDAFYADAVSWAVKNDVTNGTSNTTFSPNADCTRAEIVTFLYRAYQGK